jgi:peptidoglycan/LPS O-acetylase OafA/YrhL
MPFVFLILAAGVIGGLISLRRFLSRHPTNRQRSWLFRVGLFCFVGLLLLVALLMPLPNKHRLLAVAPVFFLIAVAARVFRSARDRMRREDQPSLAAGEASTGDGRTGGKGPGSGKRL